MEMRSLILSSWMTAEDDGENWMLGSSHVELRLQVPTMVDNHHLCYSVYKIHSRNAIHTACIAFMLPPMQPYTHVWRPQLYMNNTNSVLFGAAKWHPSTTHLVSIQYLILHILVDQSPHFKKCFVGSPTRRFTCVPRSKRNALLDLWVVYKLNIHVV